jgi:hypothetical protein
VFRRALVVAVSCLGLLGPVTAVGMGSAAADDTPVPVGAAWQPPQNAPDGNLALVGADNGSATQQAETAAVALAKKTGKPQAVAAATTQTSQVTAEPDGTLVADQNVLPVRVRSGKAWAAVSTGLARTSSGRLAAAALPGDTVSFSGGGTGPMAEISSGGSSLSLWWPGSLPAPAVSGSSAEYPDVLPGVALVLTATSAQAGGFSTDLVISSAKAARDPGLARLALRVSASGASALRSVAGGGLAAQMKGGRGWFEAPAPQMWDSSSLLPGASRTAARAAAQSAQTAGAGLAGAGLGPKSTTAGPASGALVAGVKAGVAAGGSELSLVPDQRMLTSPATKFPVYIDPSFTSSTQTGSKQAYDAVLSDSGTGACGIYAGICDTTNCRGAHFNSSSYSSAMPVGYDNFEAGPCEFSDTDYALYQVAIPSGAFGPHAVLIDASFKADEVYSSSCSASATVTASWIYGIGSGTGWPGPGLMPDNSNATASVGPDSGSCNSTEDTSSKVGAGFNVTPDLKHMSGTPSNLTVRLWENGNTNDVDHKQFASNPTLQVTWTDTPNTPSNLGESAVAGADTLGCDTSTSNPPRIGATDSIHGMDLTAKYGDPDGAAVQANVRYQIGTGGAWTTKNDVISSVNNASATWELASSVTSGLADGTLIGWQAQAETGSGSVNGSTWGPYSSGWSPECYFAVYPHSPDAPSLTPSGFTQTTSQPVGSSLSFTITQTGTDTASEFVWGFDQTPPTSGTIPAAQTCTTSSTTCKLTVAGGVASATLSVTVPSPGPHDVYVYAVDASGNESGWTDGAPGAASTSGQTWTFSGAADTPPAPFKSGGTLQANFDTALGQGASYDNAMISTQAGLPGNADADGLGNSFDSAELNNAGWKSGGTVTVDGATFRLPQFGTTGDTSDNLLADGQTIGTGSAGVHGSALVFLATSTDGFAQVPGTVGTGTSSSLEFSGDATAPFTPSGYGVTGTGCSAMLSIDPTTPCNPATGQVNYASGCTPTAPTSYTLAVPDWVSGPLDIAAVYTPDRDHPGAQQKGATPSIYAFAVPLDPACTVSSVQLPDVGDSLFAKVTSTLGKTQPALHILGMAVRDTTTATPVPGTAVGGTGTQAAPPAPSGTAWTGAWESPIEDAFSPPSGQTWGDQTMRIAFGPDAVVPKGSTVRIRLSNPGFLSGDGDTPLQISDATIGPQASTGGANVGATPQALTFDGNASVTIPAGGDVYSDPVALTNTINGRGILSLQLANSSLPVLPLNSYPAAARTWFAPSSAGDQTSVESGSAFTYAINEVPLLAGFDVATPAASYNLVQYPGEPTVVVAGNNVIDGAHVGAPTDSGNTPSSRLAGQLFKQGTAGTLFASGGGPGGGYGVTDAGLQSNMVLTDGKTAGGVSLLARLDRDILAEPDVGTVVIDEGLQDVLAADGAAATATDLSQAYGALQLQLQDFGVQSEIFGTLTPCGGFTDSTDSQQCDAATEAGRDQVNESVSTLAGYCTVDFSGALDSGDGASPADLAAADDVGDHVNLTPAGYTALAQAITNSPACLFMPPAVPPST